MCVKISKKTSYQIFVKNLDAKRDASSFCLSQLSWKTPSPAPNQLQFSRNFAPLSVRVNCMKERGGGLQKRGKVGTLLPARSEAGQTWRPWPRKWRSYKSNWCPRACQACLICPWVSNNSNIPWQARGKTAFFYTVLFCPVGCPSYGQYPKKGFWIWILGVFLILKTRVAIT